MNEPTKKSVMMITHDTLRITVISRYIIIAINDINEILFFRALCGSCGIFTGEVASEQTLFLKTR